MMRTDREMGGISIQANEEFIEIIMVKDDGGSEICGKKWWFMNIL